MVRKTTFESIATALMALIVSFVPIHDDAICLELYVVCHGKSMGRCQSRKSY